MTNSHYTMQPFDLANESDYQHWRTLKLADYNAAADDLIVPVNDIAALTEKEHAAMLERCCKINMVVYEVTGTGPAGKQVIRLLGQQFGLETLDTNLRADEDSITSLRVVEAGAGTHYIPYTNRPLNWHTDGYYNRLDEQVRSIIMHCVSTSASGGDNLFLDPEIAYLLLRDENPDYIKALMQPDVMTIPANIEAGVELRPAQSGPVFSVAQASGALHMRYTARTRSIEWKDDRITRLAVGFLLELLASDSIYIVRHRLCAGQGIICNNVLHKREAFADDAASGQERLLYRARYHERIRGTDMLNRNNAEVC
ncbi:MAG: TauD/TfdA family dioxygenase [Gammaproteobacteria bacterium]|nr:TauD/TfdA family dioxygenase [Gammaproteobacteria bacterium]